MEISLELKNVCRLTAMKCVAKTAVKQKIFTTLTLMLSNCLFSLVFSVFTTKTFVFVTANGNESLESEYYNGWLCLITTVQYKS